MPEIEFPEFPLARVFMGGCVSRGEGSNIRRSAHAHNHKNDPHNGWICVKGKNPLIVRFSDGKPARMMLHEYAHILCPNQGHNAKFYKTVYAIGGYEVNVRCRAVDVTKLVRAVWAEVEPMLRNGWQPFPPRVAAEPRKVK